ncbi:hypothetical protein QR66_17695 [Chromobacterium piscinae]|nr:hypothetical protein QR66_17695 [Chromobacterium piscinae]
MVVRRDRGRLPDLVAGGQGYGKPTPPAACRRRERVSPLRPAPPGGAPRQAGARRGTPACPLTRFEDPGETG